jgi:hypothetical protein
VIPWGERGVTESKSFTQINNKIKNLPESIFSLKKLKVFFIDEGRLSIHSKWIIEKLRGSGAIVY